MVTSRRLLKHPNTISCEDCRMVFRVENVTPLTTIARTLHCPACGSNKIIIVELQSDDYWYAMAASFGLPQKAKSVDLIRQLYEKWEPTEYPTFKEFVSIIVEEITKHDNDNGQ